MRRALALAGLGGLLLVGTASGQQQPQSLPPTTVQLPSFSFFSVNTTVSVPDRGGMYLGGVDRARDARTTRGFGPLAGRGIGGDRVAGGMSVRTTIIDHDELDRAVRAEAAARRAAADPAVAKAEAISGHVGRDSPLAATSGREGSSLPDSVAAIRARHAAAAEERTGEAAKYVAQAQKAEADGKPAMARIFYQMVARRDAGQLKQQAESRLAALAPTKIGAMVKR